jgi:methylenetetrahydrofolate reductase (NADPH)
MADRFGEDDWKDFAKEICFCYPDEFYFFEPDPETCLSSTEINREYLFSKRSAGLKAAKQKLPLGYKINRTVHDHVFEKGSLGFNIGKRISQAIDGASEGVKKAMHGLEQAVKVTGFDCRDCGDCSLPDIAYLCPESQCVKNQRNGPCGGTRQGKCEIGEKDCIWARAYDRLKAYGEEETMLDGPAIFKDGALNGTSAWGNTFLERDHHAQKKSDS